MRISLSDAEVPTKHRGSARELTVAVDLMGRGFEVFKNLSAHGMDLLAMATDGRVLRVEVKPQGNGGGVGLWDVLAVVRDGEVVYKARSGHAVDPHAVEGAGTVKTLPVRLGTQLFSGQALPAGDGGKVVAHLRRIYPMSATPKEIVDATGVGHGSVRKVCLRNTCIRRVRRGEYVAKVGVAITGE